MPFAVFLQLKIGFLELLAREFNKDLGEIQIKIREIQIKKSFCLDCRPKSLKIREIQIKIWEIQIINIESGKSK
jgi:hypothetical protein